MRDFTFPGLTTRVVFGHGTIAQAGDQLARMGHHRALVLSTPHQRADAQRLADALGASVFAGAAMHTPVDVTEVAVQAYAASGATAVVSLGGGSTTGLGKAIATRTGADQVVIPTTYAGSEMTDILGETAAGEKTTRRDASIRPEVVIYDVDLTLTLPVPLTVTSALNAMAHGMEALYAPDRNPVVALMCVDAFAAFQRSLPVLLVDPANREARSDALYAAWCCSSALGSVSMALHHKLAHVLGGSFGLPHAETHAVLLPHTTAFNEVAVPGLLAPLRIFGDTAGGGLWDFAASLNAPLSLRDLGLAEADLDHAAEIAVKSPYANPRPFDRGTIRTLLQTAYEGRRPTS